MSTIFEFIDPVDYLNHRFSVAKAKNKKLSLRAWALKMNLKHPFELHRVLNRERMLTPQLAEKIAIGLNLDESQKDYLELLAKASKAKDKNLLKKFLKRVKSYQEMKSTVDPELFQSISRWFSSPLLLLASLGGFHKEDIFLKFKGSISHKEFEHNLNQLVLLGLIEIREGFLYQAQVKESLRLQMKEQNDFVEKYLQEQLERSAWALKNLKIIRRKITSTTVALLPEDVRQAKAIVDEACQKLLDLNSSDRQAEVYQLNAQLFPIFG